MLDLNKYDKTLEELKSVLFSERKTRKINKIDPNFYKNIYSLFSDLKVEKAEALSTDIMKYMEITRLLDDVRKNFKAFFQVRFEKIARYSVYELTDDTLYNLTNEEKNIIKEFSDKMKYYYDDFIGTGKAEENAVELNDDIINGNINENKPAEENEIRGDKTGNQGSPEEIPEKMEKEVKSENYVLVRILKDLPPVAQPDKNYYLHKNDILYITESFANILKNRDSIIMINKKQKL